MKILLLFLLLIPFVLGALEECQRVTLSSGVPCSILSSDKPSTGCDENASIFLENGTFLQFLPWGNSNPFCNITWNVSDIGTYAFNSTVDNGVITIEKEDNMLSIILVQIFIVAFFVIIGLPHKVGFTKFTCWGLAIIELLITVWIVYLNEIGGDVISFLRFNSFGMLILGGTLGIYSLIVMLLKLMNPGKNKDLHDDGYTKFVHGK